MEKIFVTVQGGTAVRLRRRQIHPEKAGFRPRAGVLGSYGPCVLPLQMYSFADSRPLRFVRFHRQPSGTASTLLAGPSGALGFTGESAADLFDP
ncbi:MAG: hypothetical protein JXA30_17665 [Deltaproteobacteria bacterium]|nr:hypothetical protein [Deltaproteobacteria bacterium]